MTISWRKTKAYRAWRAIVIRRDSRCIICGSIKQREAHHLNHATFFKDERFDIANGATLCKSCHTQYHTNFHSSFREKCTKDKFSNFIKLVAHYITK